MHSTFAGPQLRTKNEQLQYQLDGRACVVAGVLATIGYTAQRFADEGEIVVGPRGASRGRGDRQSRLPTMAFTELSREQQIEPVIF